MEEIEFDDTMLRGAYGLNSSAFPPNFNLSRENCDLTPGVKTTNLFRAVDFDKNEFANMGLHGEGLNFMQEALTWMSPTIMNVIHREGPLIPLLDPDKLRVITREAILRELSRMGVTLNSNKFRAVGVTGVLANCEGENRLYDGLLDISMERDDIRERIYVVTDKKIEGELPLAAGIQLAHYPVATYKGQKVNLRGLVGSIEGEGITPGMVQMVLEQAGASTSKPYGFVTVIEGDQVCNGPLTIPKHTLRDSSELANYSTPQSVSGIHGGFGIGTGFDDLGAKLNLREDAKV